ncbi:MAG: hypothetical protein H8E98_02125, partial [Bacteroidetes bacterium]|nr:hypothetical protein [Bacteroidota bacterium]
MDTCNFLKTPRFQHLFLQKDNIFRFLILQVFLIFGLSNYSFAQTTLTAQSAIGSASTSSSTFSTVTRASVTIDVTSINYILVVATFQVEMTSPDGHGREASFRIADNASQETINSGTIKRSLANAKSTDYGIGSVVYIFDVSELSNNRTYVLQHAFSTVARTLTTNGTIVAVALKGGSEHLKNDVKRVSSPVTMGTEWAAVSGSETSVITTTVTGGFYVAASIESKTSSFTTSSVAEWKLQYKKGALGSWTDLCTSVERSMSNTSDRGIINLVGTLPDGSTSGDYYFQIAHRRTSPSSTINTETCNITAVSLGITAGNFPVFMEMATGVSTASSSLVNAVTASMTPSANTSLFIHAQYGITGTEATNST